MRFDIESLMDQLVAKFKVFLDQEIDALNLEKNPNYLDDPNPVIVSAPIIPKLAAGAYIVGSLDDRAKNYKDFAFIEVDAVNAIVNEQGVVKNVVIQFDLIFYDRQDMHVQRRIYRYQRVLIDALVRTWDTVAVGYDKAKISSLEPIDLKLNNSSLYHKAVGAELSFAIAD